MKILAFDNSTPSCSVALQSGAEIKTLSANAPMQQAKLILPMIQELLALFSLNLSQLDAIAFGCGPGSFTGIRIASSVAQGLGLARGLPIIRISSLAALAQDSFSSYHKPQILIAIDARMGHLYGASYLANTQGMVELQGTEEASPPELITFQDGHDQSLTIAIGDGWQKYPNELEAKLGYKPQFIDIATLSPARGLIPLAQSKFAAKEWVSAAHAIPDYLR